MSVRKNTLGLVMIVKNESKVILRCLESVAAVLDFWVIHDTGSTDGTPDIIKNFFDKRGIPGELHHTPWRNFGYNRSQAVAGARGKMDYAILMDADFIFNLKDPNFKSKLTADGYNIRYEGALDYRQCLLVRAGLRWRYIGVTHEYIHCPDAKNMALCDGFTFTHFADGGSRADKFARDVRLLEEGLKDEPNNARYMFYLGQSYKDLGEPAKAIKAYQQRIDAGGWGEETYYALYQIGMCLMRLERPFDEVASAFLRAYFFRPSRLEALYHLVNYCRLGNKPGNNYCLYGFAVGLMGVNTPYPDDLLFIEKSAHEYLLLDEVALCAYYSEHYREACELSERILREHRYPEGWDKRLRENHDWYLKGYRKHFGVEYSAEGAKSLNLPVGGGAKLNACTSTNSGTEMVSCTKDVVNPSAIFKTTVPTRYSNPETAKPLFSFLKDTKTVDKPAVPSDSAAIFKTTTPARAVTEPTTRPQVPGMVAPPKSLAIPTNKGFMEPMVTSLSGGGMATLVPTTTPVVTAVYPVLDEGAPFDFLKILQQMGTSFTPEIAGDTCRVATFLTDEATPSNRARRALHRRLTADNVGKVHFLMTRSVRQLTDYRPHFIITGGGVLTTVIAGATVIPYYLSQAELELSAIPDVMAAWYGSQALAARGASKMRLVVPPVSALSFKSVMRPTAPFDNDPTRTLIGYLGSDPSSTENAMAVEIAEAYPEGEFLLVGDFKGQKIPQNATVQAITDLVAPLYARCRYLIVPSAGDQISLTAYEAVRSGVTVVASDFPSLRESIGATNTAMYVENKPAAFATALRAFPEIIKAFLQKMRDQQNSEL